MRDFSQRSNLPSSSGRTRRIWRVIRIWRTVMSGCLAASVAASLLSPVPSTASSIAGVRVHSIQFVIDGGGLAITTGALNSFPTVDFACTINRIDVSADQVGSITVDLWKAAGAIPTAANKISASAPATLAAVQLSQNGSLAGWSTAVAIGDVFGGTIATASTVQRVTVQVWCQ